MDPNLTRRIHLVCAWSGIAYVVLLFASLIAMGFFPWPAPSRTADQIAQDYQDNTFFIRIGAIGMMFGALAFLPFSSLIAQHIKRFEGDRSTILTTMYTMAAFANAMLTFYPAMWWLTAAFRPDRGSELIYLINDASWLQFFGGYSLTLPMFWIPALMALTNRDPDPVFPRWMGYFNIFVSIIILPDQALFFFYRGPFAWNGLIAVWIPLAFFGAWFFVMFHFLRRHALRMPRN